MNFKIESNHLDITNYPSIERHLENMASKGWLIYKIIAGNIFIYKKIQPELLDFSISPYEVETAFTIKSKEELEEFNSACKSIGWNYATKSFDLHIYFKKQGSEAMDIQTDEEEEFYTLELIGEKHLKSYYLQIPMLLFFSWLIFGRISTGVSLMKDGIAQIVMPLVPIGVIFLIINLINIKKFLNRNRRNIELGKSIEFIQSKFYFNKITFSFVNITMFILMLYLIYSSMILRNRFMLIGLIPTLIGVLVGIIYRFFIKPARITLKHKKIAFVLTFVSSVFLSIVIFLVSIMYMANRENKNVANVDNLKVLSVNDFDDKTLEEGSDLIRQTSILIPSSYEYYSYSRSYGSVRTEYSKVLTDGLANNLVNRYKNQAKNALTGRFSMHIELFLEEGIFSDYLLRNGLTIEDLNIIKDKDSKKAVEIARNIVYEKSVVKDIEDLWEVDEAYFLNYEKTEIVIRDGREVFYLDGLDFSDYEIIETTKNRLGLSSLF